MRPSDYNPEFTDERLVKIAQLIQRGRNDAVDRHEPEIGGTNWTRGVCAYSFACHQIEQASGTTGFEWLEIIDNGMRFQFSIGNVLMRFWRGDPSEPTAKISAATPVEQYLLDLEPGIPTAGLLYRIGYVTDFDGSMLQAFFAAMRNGVSELVWPISLDNADPLIIVLDDTRPEGRELPAPYVGDRQDDVGDADDGTEETNSGQ